MPIYILGISAFYHDSTAALVWDGEIIAAAQEERFTRCKGDATLPHHAIAYCLEAGEISSAQLVSVAFYEKPLSKFERYHTPCHSLAARDACVDAPVPAAAPPASPVSARFTSL